MGYGSGKAFILAERSIRVETSKRLNWYSNMPSRMNNKIRGIFPWTGTLFSKAVEHSVKSDLAKTPFSEFELVSSHNVVTSRSRSLIKLQGTDLVENISKDLSTTSPLPTDYRSIMNSLEKKTTDGESKARETLSASQDEAWSGQLASRLPVVSDINFLKKEFAFTKLKYSRSPQYDAVSGGFAALLAGFIGFLITEKFGIELVDSGDFFIAFMYVVFIGFIGRLIILTSSDVSSPRFSFSLRHNLLFFKSLTILVIRKIKLF